MWIITNKIFLTVAAIAIAFTALFGYIKHSELRQEQEIKEEIEYNKLKEYQSIRRNVDNAIEESREANPDSSGSVALDRLRERHSNSGE